MILISKKAPQRMNWIRKFNDLNVMGSKDINNEIKEQSGEWCEEKAEAEI